MTTSSRVLRTQRGFTQYIILAVLLLAAATVVFFQSRKPAPSPNALTASLTGSGGVTITTPDNNATLTSPVHVIANVASGFTGPVRTMQVFADNTLVYQGAGTTVDTNLTLSAGATHNLTVLALKKNGASEAREICRYILMMTGSVSLKLRADSAGRTISFSPV
jgi:hypothetical protein